MTKSVEKFPGLDAIRAKKARPESEKGKPGRKPRPRSLEELRMLSPSDRQRVIRSQHLVVAADVKGNVAVQIVPRPGSLTPELLGDIVKGLASGGALHVVAGALGIPRATIDDWMAKGEDEAIVGQLGGAIYGVLVESVARARWAAEQAALSVVASGRKGWQGRAWILERMKPHEYAAPPRRLEHSGPGGGGIRFTASSVEMPNEVPEASLIAPVAFAAAHDVSKANGHSNGVELPEEHSEDLSEEEDLSGSARGAPQRRR